MAVKSNQFDKSALTSLIGLLGPPEKLIVGSSHRLRWFFPKNSGDPGHPGLRVGLS